MHSGHTEMETYISAFAKMWEEMWHSSAEFQPDLRQDPRAVILNGMGGSSIGGALLDALIGDSGRVPILINRTYSVPRWADSNTLAVCTSYSGNTEETLSAFDSAGRQGAQRVAFTTGGQLAERCADESVPFQLIPPGLPPRAALPYTLVPLLSFARHVNLLALAQIDIEETTRTLHALCDDESAASQGRSGRSAEIADRLDGKIPVVYSGPGLMSAVNLRWRGQIQENAKSLAFGNVYPELNHNEIVGWQLSESTTQEIAVIELVDEDDSGEIRARMDLTRSLLKDKAADWITVHSTGPNRLARMMHTVLLGDWVSLRLAALKEVDPMPVALIDALKSGLAAAREG